MFIFQESCISGNSSGQLDRNLLESAKSSLIFEILEVSRSSLRISRSLAHLWDSRDLSPIFEILEISRPSLRFSRSLSWALAVFFLLYIAWEKCHFYLFPSFFLAKKKVVLAVLGQNSKLPRSGSRYRWFFFLSPQFRFTNFFPQTEQEEKTVGDIVVQSLLAGFKNVDKAYNRFWPNSCFYTFFCTDFETHIGTVLHALAKIVAPARTHFCSNFSFVHFSYRLISIYMA